MFFRRLFSGAFSVTGLATALVGGSLSGCVYITDTERAERFDPDGDGVEFPYDCDNTDPERRQIRTLYLDADGDGYGDEDNALDACGPQDGYVALSGDCDDDLPSVFPNATEPCDGLDNDCDGQIDEDNASITYYRDADADGFGSDDDQVQACLAPAGYTVRSGDCADEDREVHPDAIEVCDDVDNDCDDLVDDEDDSLEGLTLYVDADQDGFGDESQTIEACDPPSGSYSTESGDCADSDPNRFPGALEYCNQTDDDCDNEVDEDAVDRDLWFGDADNDGYGNIFAPIESCEQPADAVLNASDCDDGAGNINPGATEICDDGLDNDCDERFDGDDTCVAP